MSDQCVKPQPRFYYYPTRVNDKLVHFIMDRETGRPVDVAASKASAQRRVAAMNARLITAEAPRRESGPKAAPTPGQLAYEDDLRDMPSYLDGHRRRLWSDLAPEIQNIWEQVAPMLLFVLFGSAWWLLIGRR